FDIVTAAKKIGRSEEEIQGWEDGTQQPTLAQARKTAEVYKRSLAVFYLPEPPQGIQTLRDFRHLHKSSEYSPELVFLIQLVEYRQNWLRERLEAEGVNKIEFIGSASLNTPVVKLAEKIRKYLKITSEQQMNLKTRREALNFWINKSEEVGINVCREGSIECNEVRGFAITDSYAPFIFINSNDALASQLFSLVHELVHLWINSSGISNLKGLGKTGSTEEERIEIFCNQVASFVLMEENIFNILWSQPYQNDKLEDRIYKISDKLKVSEEAVARRLLDREIITTHQYSILRESFIERWKRLKLEEYQKERQKKKKGGPSPNLLKVLSNGKIFTRAVLISYFNGTLSGTDASNYLNAKINNFGKLSKYVGLIYNP
ncbi:ImmA/IrrE family metallo-endopeptidase, partial [Candidatus Poribacteria bacterium]|nr:ImmA/IrrE family metallo-endopeptidase [Candidatus Poribacteria bacterium]